jgi:hypothetical protein
VRLKEMNPSKCSVVPNSWYCVRVALSFWKRKANVALNQEIHGRWRNCAISDLLIMFRTRVLSQPVRWCCLLSLQHSLVLPFLGLFLTFWYVPVREAKVEHISGIYSRMRQTEIKLDHSNYGAETLFVGTCWRNRCLKLAQCWLNLNNVPKTSSAGKVYYITAILSVS